MIRIALRSVLAMLVLTVVFGLVYPVVMTGFAQLAFSSKAQGSLITRDGKVIGSSLAAQKFTGKQYFHVRPSATVPPYNAAATTFANLGPTNPALADAVKANIASVLKLEGPYNPGLTAAGIPVDAVTTSGSGIDPAITPAYADLQARRVAAVRGIPLDAVEGLISQHTDGRFLGFLGEPGVNVLQLNLALDEVNH